MGGSVNTGGQNQNQTSVTTPWAPAAGQVQGLLGQLGTVNTSPHAGGAAGAWAAHIARAAGQPVCAGDRDCSEYAAFRRRRQQSGRTDQ